MAKIQFGQSFCQIEGKYVPVADFKLAGGDGVYFAHHLLLWKDEQVQISKMPLAKGWKRLFAGLPLIMTQATRARPHRVFQGCAGRIDRPAGGSRAIGGCPRARVSRRHQFQSRTTGFSPASGSLPRTAKTPKRIIRSACSWTDLPPATVPGLLLLHGNGNVFIRSLQPGQQIVIKPTSLLFKDPTVLMNLHLEYPGGMYGAFQPWGRWSNRYVWLRLSGPGRVAVQSHFEPMEDPGFPSAGPSRSPRRGSGERAKHRKKSSNMKRRTV